MFFFCFFFHRRTHIVTINRQFINETNKFLSSTAQSKMIDSFRSPLLCIHFVISFAAFWQRHFLHDSEMRETEMVSFSSFQFFSSFMFWFGSNRKLECDRWITCNQNQVNQIAKWFRNGYLSQPKTMQFRCWFWMNRNINWIGVNKINCEMKIIGGSQHWR